MIIRRKDIPFENAMTRAQMLLGWLYLLLHVAVLPWLLNLVQEFSPDPLSDRTANLIYYGVGIAFCLTVMYSFLRVGFDVLADHPLRVIGTILMAFMIDYALSGAAALVMMLFETAVENPNNEQILELADLDPGAIKGITIFLVPIVEEVLFRGVVFGSVRRRSRVWAYVVSAAAFSLYHVWRYALLDASQLIYIVQYIPISIVLAWAYERSGTIWTGIFFHMGINAMSFAVLETLERL